LKFFCKKFHFCNEKIVQNWRHNPLRQKTTT
jgi:hypothetical protein